MSRQETQAESCVQRAFVLGAAPLLHHLPRSRACYTYVCVTPTGLTAVTYMLHVLQPPPRARKQRSAFRVGGVCVCVCVMMMRVLDNGWLLSPVE
jgi:hypothetical protein